MSRVESVKGIDVVHWNPHERLRPTGLARKVRVPARKNNFGDLLGPLVTRLMTATMRSARSRRRLLTVGSIMHFARTDDVVWGTGVNGKVSAGLHRFDGLDVRAVRGPLTRRALELRGLQVPAVFGDPALLLPDLRPDLRDLRSRASGTLLVPNLNDASDQGLARWGRLLDPRSPVEECLRAIVGSELVISSSLHGIVVAEAFGVPVVPVVPLRESTFKYDDHFQGTGRPEVSTAASFEAAVRDPITTPPLVWQAAPLVAAFPSDLWQPSVS